MARRDADEEAAARAARLKAALRANLIKRKAQARATGRDDQGTTGETGAAPDVAARGD